MKYMLLIYNNLDALMSLPKDELDGIMGEAEVIMNELKERGEFLGGHGLAHPSQTKTVRVRDGVVATTDGPFVEAKEQFAGTVLMDVESEERALEIATRWPDAKRYAVELRAIMHEAKADL
jgi:hypothetical protein